MQHLIYGILVGLGGLPKSHQQTILHLSDHLRPCQTEIGVNIKATNYEHLCHEIQVGPITVKKPISIMRALNLASKSITRSDDLIFRFYSPLHYKCLPTEHFSIYKVYFSGKAMALPSVYQPRVGDLGRYFTVFKECDGDRKISSLIGQPALSMPPWLSSVVLDVLDDYPSAFKKPVKARRAGSSLYRYISDHQVEVLLADAVTSLGNCTSNNKKLNSVHFLYNKLSDGLFEMLRNKVESNAKFPSYATQMISSFNFLETIRLACKIVIEVADRVPNNLVLTKEWIYLILRQVFYLRVNGYRSSYKSKREKPEPPMYPSYKERLIRTYMAEAEANKVYVHNWERLMQLGEK